MGQLIRHQASVILVAAIVFLTNLGAAQLWDEDEPRNAGCAREMLERSDWVVPTFNYELRTHKPVLLYWLMMGTYTVFGITELAARLPSALLAIGTCLCTYHLGRLLFRAEVGLWAGLIMATSLMFVVSGRAATPDSSLIFFSTLSLVLFVKFSGLQWKPDEAARENPSRSEQSSWAGFVLMYAAMGLAVLAKGPIGAAFPVGTIGLFLLWQGRAGQGRAAASTGTSTAALAISRIRQFAVLFWKSAWKMRPLTLLVVIVVVAAPWYYLVSVRTDGEWLRGFLGEHVRDRFNRPMEGHGGPVLYYLPAIMAGFFPWSVLLPLALWRLIGSIRSAQPWRPGAMLLVCWGGLYVALFSLAGTKLPSYVLPAYPALALITACLIDGWTAGAEIHRVLTRVALGAVMLVGLVLLIALPLAADRVLQGERIIGAVGLIPLIGGAAALWCDERRQPRRAAAAFAGMAVFLAVGLFGFAAPWVSRHQNSARLIALAESAGAGHAQIATFKYSASSIVYYARRQVVRCAKPEEVGDFFNSANHPFLIVDAEHLKKLRPELPLKFEVIAREPRFLKAGQELLLIGRKTETAQRSGPPVLTRRTIQGLPLPPGEGWGEGSYTVSGTLTQPLPEGEG